MKEKSNANIIIAQKYFEIYNYLKNKEDIESSQDAVKYLKELNKNRYKLNGRYLKDEEIIGYEIYNIQSMLIDSKYDNYKYRDYVSNIYNKLIKTKVSYEKDKIDYYKSCINAIYCLLNILPPFLDDVYEKCDNIENRKIKR